MDADRLDDFDDTPGSFADALLDLVFGPPTIPPGDGASAPRPGVPSGAGCSDPADEDLDERN